MLVGLAAAAMLPGRLDAQHALQPVGRIDAQHDVGPVLEAIRSQRGGPLLLLRDVVYRVPPACLGRDTAAAQAGAAALVGDGPGCRFAEDGNGFWMVDPRPVDRAWYYDGELRMLRTEFVPLDPRDLLSDGRAYAEAGRDPSEVNAVFNRGVRDYRAERWQRAREAFEHAAQLDPHFADPAFYHLLVLDRLEAWGAMIEPGERTLALDPLNQTAIVLLARAYQRSGFGRAEHRLRLPELREQLRSLPAYFSAGARLSPACALTGTLLGGAAAAGTEILLQVTLRAPDGEETVRTVRLSAPARGKHTEVTAPLDGCAGPGTRMRYALRANQK